MRLLGVVVVRRTLVLVGALGSGCTAQAFVADASPAGTTTSATGEISTSSSSTAQTADSTGDAPDLGSPEFPCQIAEAVRSSVGCNFIAGAHLPSGVAMSNMGDEPANVTVSKLSRGIIEELTIDVGAVEFVVFDLDGNIFPTPGISDAFAHEIVSDQPLQAWQFTPPLAQGDNDASILFPVHTLGTRHRLASYVGSAQTTEFGGTPDTPLATQNLVIHAVEDDTEVRVTLAAPSAMAFGELSIDVAAGFPTAMTTLQRGETWLLEGDTFLGDEDALPYEVDWTGSEVESDKPILVYVASFTAIPVGMTLPEPDSFCCADTVGALIPPTEVLGTEYAVAKTIPVGAEYDVFRVVADTDRTAITIRGAVEHDVTLDTGEFFEFTTTGGFVAEGNQAFVLAQYLTSSALAFPRDLGRPFPTADCENFSGTPGDPGMSVVFPVDNWLDRYNFPVGAAGIGGGWCHDHATVTAPLATWDAITLSGNPLPAVTPIGQSAYGFAYVELAGQDVWALEAPVGTGAQLDVYGYQDDGSFIYPGGMRLEILNPEG